MTNFSLTVPLESLVWYIESPDAGDPAYLCSHCGKAILAGEMPIRLYRDLGNGEALEARFHDVCLGEVSTLKIQPMSREQDDDLEDEDDDEPGPPWFGRDPRFDRQGRWVGDNHPYEVDYGD